MISCCYWSLGRRIMGLPPEVAAKWMDEGKTVFLGSYEEARDAYSKLRFAPKIPAPEIKRELRD